MLYYELNWIVSSKRFVLGADSISWLHSGKSEVMIMQRDQCVGRLLAVKCGVVHKLTTQSEQNKQWEFSWRKIHQSLNCHNRVLKKMRYILPKLTLRQWSYKKHIAYLSGATVPLLGCMKLRTYILKYVDVKQINSISDSSFYYYLVSYNTTWVLHSSDKMTKLN